MLSLNGITVRLGGRTILDRATAALPPNTCIGLIGRNGAGKSTLMKVMIGSLEPDEGSVEMPRATRIGYIAQDAPSGILLLPLGAHLASLVAQRPCVLPQGARHRRSGVGWRGGGGGRSHEGLHRVRIGTRRVGKDLPWCRRWRHRVGRSFRNQAARRTTDGWQLAHDIMTGRNQTEIDVDGLAWYLRRADTER